MQRVGRITASIEETRHYLVLLVHNLLTAYKKDSLVIGVEAESGYRESLETYLFSSTSNVIKTTFNNLKKMLLEHFGAVLSYDFVQNRIFFYIEPIKTSA